jgi:hypothetical protein
MTLEQLQQWAKAQINHQAPPEIRPDIGVSVLQLVEEVEDLKDQIRELEARLSVTAVRSH